MNDNMLIHIPHSSMYIPQEYMRYFQVDLEIIQQNIVQLTDFKTDDLFDHPAHRNRLVFPISRLLCDVERFRNDQDEIMTKKGMGVCYTHGASGEVLHPYSESLRAEIINRYYDPHHTQLLAMSKEIIENQGSCIIVDAHSFPSKPLPYEIDQDDDRADFCIGTDAIHTPLGLSKAVSKCIEGLGYSVALNKPFSGTIVPLSMLGGTEKIFSVMIEINRKLYMDESTQTILPAYDDIKAAVNKILESISTFFIDHRCIF